MENKPGVLRKALESLPMKNKKDIVIQATLQGVDLDKVIETFDEAFELVRPLYKKN